MIYLGIERIQRPVPQVGAPDQENLHLPIPFVYLIRSILFMAVAQDLLR